MINITTAIAILIMLIVSIGPLVYSKMIESSNAKISAEMKVQRYQLACIWCSALSVSSGDIHCFANHVYSDAMHRWKVKTGRDPLIIEEFRDYVIKTSPPGAEDET